MIVAFFVLELLARLAYNGWRFLRRPLNAFDAAVIVVSALPIAGVDASLLRLARLARLVHFARHAAHLRLLRSPADREIVPAMTIHQLTDVDPFSVRVSVYRNLRTGGWSVKTAERVGEVPKGKVIAHADQCDHRRRL